MSLTVFSKFYYGTQVTSTTNKIDFDEGAAEITATLTSGGYSLTDYATEIQRAMNAVGGQTYTVAVTRSSRVITISAAGSFTLRVTTGTNVNDTAYTTMGFTANKTGTSNVSDSGAGSEYKPQFKLQNHISTDDWQAPYQEKVNETSTGTVEIVRFGTQKFMQGNIIWITNIEQPTGYIENNATGVSDARSFMQYIVQKFPIEYMEDRDSTGTFQTMILNKTPESGNGTTYKLKEMYSNRSLPGYFETGNLVFRLIE